MFKSHDNSLWHKFLLKNCFLVVSDQVAVDQQKIDSIKQALLEGKYQVDADKVAEKFIEIEKALGKV